MKKSIFSLMTVLMVLTLCSSLTSCKDDSNDSDNNLIVGSWKSMRVMGDYDTSQTLVLPSSGKGTWIKYSKTRTFTYSFSNNRLSMTFDNENGDPYTECYTVELLTTNSLNFVTEGSTSEYSRYRFSRQ